MTATAERAQGGDVRPGSAEQLRQALPGEHEHGQPGDRAEHRQRDHLRPDRLLHLVADDRRAADVKGQAGQLLVGRQENLALHRGGQRGQLALERRYPRSPPVQPHPDPGELVRREQPAGGGRREDSAVLGIGLVGQHRRDIHDPGHQERGTPGRVNLPGRGILPVELVGHPAAGTHAEHVRNARSERDLVGRAGARQPAGQHG
jgi:hypothetical protein